MKLILKNIEANLGDFKLAVKNWQCESGSHILIRGGSGLGKTTFLHILAGLFTPQKGEVILDHFNLSSLSDRERGKIRRKSVGLVFQRLNLMEKLTVYENIALGCYPHKPRFEEIQKILEKLQLAKKIETSAAVLSLGEQQRVAVARALINSPNLVLADEPTSSLDDQNAETVMNYLNSATIGKTLIVVSHDHRIEKFFPKVINFEGIVSS